jgi:hypothetical protein
MVQLQNSTWRDLFKIGIKNIWFSKTKEIYFNINQYRQKVKISQRNYKY